MATGCAIVFLINQYPKFQDDCHLANHENNQMSLLMIGFRKILIMKSECFDVHQMTATFKKSDFLVRELKKGRQVDVITLKSHF